MFEATWQREKQCHSYDFEMIVMRHVNIMLPAELTPGFKIPPSPVKMWNANMQHVDRVSDSEEESVPDTQEQWAPPAKKSKTH